MEMSPFQIVDHLNKKTSAEIDMNDYNAWIINRALSNHPQTVLFAVEMSRYYDLPKDVQYTFYFEGIPKGNRFGKWQSKDKKTNEIQLIQDYFSINRKRAEEYASILNENQLAIIAEKMNKGGKHGSRSRS